MPTGAAYYAYDESGRVLGEYDANLVPVYETVYTDVGPVAVLKQDRSAQVVQTQVNYVYADQIGTPRVITRSTDNAIVWRWDQAEPFGATPPDQNPNGFGVFAYNQRMPGQVYDSESATFYNWHRTYDPATGRYLQSDPIGLNGGLNTYRYVGGNPISVVDSLGLYPAIQVTLPNGTTYIPMTRVKNTAQAAAYGLPLGTPTAIATPPGADPQGDVDQWTCTKDKGFGAFKKYWSAPSHDYKMVNGPMYDAYGNFEYGATGYSADFPLWILQSAAQYLHNFKNNPINTNDINSGFNAISSGGKLSVVDYKPPAPTSH